MSPAWLDSAWVLPAAEPEADAPMEGKEAAWPDASLYRALAL